MQGPLIITSCQTFNTFNTTRNSVLHVLAYGSHQHSLIKPTASPWSFTYEHHGFRHDKRLVNTYIWQPFIKTGAKRTGHLVVQMLKTTWFLICCVEQQNHVSIGVPCFSIYNSAIQMLEIGKGKYNKMYLKKQW